MGAPVGAVIGGRYKVRSLIGAGGMGAVYEGVQVELGKRVAIKLIVPELDGSAEVLARFRREARATTRAESENIVQVFDCGRDDQHGFYLVMELLQGEDLEALLERRTRLQPNEALEIALQVARGLAKAHEAGVIHRDLKPGNIFLVSREDGPPLVKIVDFGISKVFEDFATGTEVTKAGSVVGTVQYMSPEQARGLPVDERADVWSLGCVMFEMLSGQKALRAEATFEKTMVQLFQHGIRPLRNAAPGLDSRIYELVDAALSFKIDYRTPTAREVAAQITQLLRGDLVPDTVRVHEPEDDDATVVGSLHDIPVEDDPSTDATAFMPRSALAAPVLSVPVVEEPEDEMVSPSAARAVRQQLKAAPVVAAAPAARPSKLPYVIAGLVALLLVVGLLLRARGSRAPVPPPPVHVP